ncbi:hypothetical protein [Heyndrickxia camelliae]|uniref:Uncharacterized protein n=1 Tax=Heyndrickxia camelliae TaxID=1707093 RepID=A0A2N3LDC7_9BACI|nr:hypothetical protein [Heyndrickxia camelliae]PKR82596.1 hypothetical protein CWO92_23470 [Heyndrickxia camelliae]
MGFRIGSYYIGSSEPQISIANEEIIPSPPSNWTSGYNFVYFTFNNDADCTVLINGKDEPLFVRSGQGFSIGAEHPPIYSFKIVEDSIPFTWAGIY